MKKKSLLTLLLALVMVFTMASTVMAADTYSITVNNASTGHVYEAYQVFAGKLFIKNTDEKVLSDIVWGNGVDQTKEVDGKNVAAAFDNKSAEEIAAALKTSADAAAFAKKIAPYLTNPSSSGAQADGKYVISNLSAGYYLVKDKDNTLNTKDDFYTAYIMQVVADVNADPKGDKPSVDKEIKEGDKTVASNTASIGDKIEYVVSSKVPDMSNYEKYYFILNDTMSKGLTFNNDVNITIGDKTLGADDYTVTFVVDKDNKTTAIKIVFKDFIRYKDKKGADIKVTYSATLNQDADITSTGNINEVRLVYSNNPNITPKGDDEPGENDNVTGETPKSEVKTYTTGLKLTKIDGKTKETLTGAKFEIKGDGVKVVLINKEVYKASENGTFYMLKDGTYTETASTDATADQYDSTTTKYEKVAVVDKTTVPTEINAKGYVNANGILTFEGLGEGTYTITELVAPNGYNLLKAPITITITANATLDGCTWTVKNGETGLTAGTDHLFAFNVVNNAGTELPSTGGIGTTVFYVLGSVLVLGAIVLLVTKRRMKRS